MPAYKKYTSSTLTMQKYKKSTQKPTSKEPSKKASFTTTCHPKLRSNKAQMSFYVYILLCIDGSFYTGYTKDIGARTRLHQNGNGARYTKAHKPQKLAYTELFDSRGKAMKREREIKKLTHQQKLDLV